MGRMRAVVQSCGGDGAATGWWLCCRAWGCGCFKGTWSTGTQGRAENGREGRLFVEMRWAVGSSRFAKALALCLFGKILSQV